jgi:fatty-acid peroxygenase
MMPHDGAPDSTLALVREGYAFLPERHRRLHTDVFEMRLLLQRTISMTGRDAAMVFYDDARFQRASAAPSRLTGTLFGVGGVQALDGAGHLKRKQLFMSFMSPPRIDELVAMARTRWEVTSEHWARRPRVVVFEEAQRVFYRAVCTWAGLPAERSRGASRLRDIVSLIESPGAIGVRHLRGRLGRRRADRRAASLVEDVRNGSLVVQRGTLLEALATFRDEHGRTLDPLTAGVELLNVIRPTVAVAHYVVFLMSALHAFPAARNRVLAGDDDPESFVHEVRRYYPFFPFVAARVRDDFEWSGYRFPAGTRALLDLYGTNHDARLWDEPWTFRPARFDAHDIDPFALIPQGGGDHTTGHRCAGEWITIALMKDALDFFTRSLAYSIPPQDLRMSLRRMPALPNSGFVIENVRSAR